MHGTTGNFTITCTTILAILMDVLSTVAGIEPAHSTIFPFPYSCAVTVIVRVDTRVGEVEMMIALPVTSLDTSGRLVRAL